LLLSRNNSIYNASIGFPQSESTVNVTYVAEPNAPRKRYEIKFVDTQGSKYVCDMDQRTDEVMVTMCRKQVGIDVFILLRIVKWQ